MDCKYNLFSSIDQFLSILSDNLSDRFDIDSDKVNKVVLNLHSFSIHRN